MLSVGITYAFFVSLISSGNTNLASSGKLDVYYTGDQIVSGGLIPSLTKESGLTATSTVKLNADSMPGLLSMSLKLNALPGELAIAGLKWEVYKDDVLYVSGTFANSSQGETLNMFDDYSITTTLATFKIYVWLNGNESDNSVMNKLFSFDLFATTTIGDTINDTSTVSSTTNPITITNGTNSNLKGYKIYGVGTQSTTPTPSAPSEIQTLGTYNSTTEKYDITINVKGKNLWPMYTNGQTDQGVTLTIADDGTVTMNGTATAHAHFTKSIELIDGQAYTISASNQSVNSGVYLFNRDFYNSTYQNVGLMVLSTINRTSTFTYTKPSNNYQYSRIILYASNGTTISNFVVKPQLEEGNVATEYEPYFTPTTTTISLDEPLRCIGTVCDYIDYENNRVVRRIGAFVFTGNEPNFTYSPSYSNTNYKIFRYNLSYNLGFNTGYVTSVSSHMQSQASSWSNHGDGMYTFQDANSNNQAIIWMSFTASRFADLEAFKQYLRDENTAGRPITVLYPLYSPEYETIDLPSIVIYEKTNYITISDGNNSPSNVEIEYYDLD